MANQSKEVKSRLNPTAHALILLALIVAVVAVAVSGFGLVNTTTVPSMPGLPHAAAAASAAGASSSVTSTTSTAAPATAAQAQRLSLEKQIANEATDSGVPQRAFFPPNYLSSVQSPSAGTGITLTPLPGVDPVGLSDFGVNGTTGTSNGAVQRSNSWEGQLTVNSADEFEINNDGPNWYGVQLNTQLANVTVANNSGAGVYWTQDVFEYSPVTHQGDIVDNIWNFSCSTCTGTEPATTFYHGNGTATGEFYYDFIELNGLPATFTLSLWTNASETEITAHGWHMWVPEVTFGISISKYFAGNYDQVQFNSGANDTPILTPQFEVNGLVADPTGFIPYDSEIVLCGPGGGSSANFYGFNGTLGLWYWNATKDAYKTAPNVWNVGWATGETAAGLAEHYVVPWGGIVYVQGGPSIPAPLWGSVPGGNAGTLTATGTLAPDNAWIFAQTAPGPVVTDSGRWAPTTDVGTYTFQLPPGSYVGWAGLSNYDPDSSLAWAGANGATVTQNIALTQNFQQGIYTPLYAWNNAQLSAFLFNGGDTVWNNAAGNVYVNTLFDQWNDYLFPQFAGVLFDGTTLHANLTQPDTFTVNYADDPFWSGIFTRDGLNIPTQQLGINLYHTDYVGVWGATDLNTWFGLPFATPYASIVLWNAANSVIGDNVFNAAGPGLILMNDSAAGGTNTVWGNWFNEAPTQLTSWTPTGILEYESGDAIWNNWLGTTPEASSPHTNLYGGWNQRNWNDWNLTGAVPVPSSTVYTVQGFSLTGSINGQADVCGNVWINDVPANNPTIPYNASGAIAAGGDYCVQSVGGFTYGITLSETGLTAGTSWGVALTDTTTGQTWTLTGTTASWTQDALLDGTYSWWAVGVSGFVASPSNGNITLNGASGAITVPYVAVTLTINSPTAGWIVSAPVFNMSVQWTTTNPSPWISEGIQVLSLDGAYVWGSVNSKNLPYPSALSSYSTEINYTSNYLNGGVSSQYPSTLPAGCYLLAIGAYNGTSLYYLPTGNVGTWTDMAEQEFCVASVSLTGPTAGSVITAGNVSVSYSWDSPGASLVLLQVYNGSSATGTPVFTEQITLGRGFDQNSVWVSLLTPGTFTANLAVQNGFGYWANSTSTFSVVAPPSQGASKPIYYNTTTTTWNNESASSGTSAYGLASNVLSTAFMEIGLIVGIILGLLVGMMFFSKGRKPMSGGSPPSSDDAMGGSSSSTGSTSSTDSSSSSSSSSSTSGGSPPSGGSS